MHHIKYDSTCFRHRDTLNGINDFPSSFLIIVDHLNTNTATLIDLSAYKHEAKIRQGHPKYNFLKNYLSVIEEYMFFNQER